MYYYILSYTILSSSSILFYSSPSLPLLISSFPSSSSSAPSFYKRNTSISNNPSLRNPSIFNIHLSHFILYVSALTYAYLYSRLIFPIFKNNLTPHVLSEWMVEVCRFDKCGVRLGFENSGF